MSKSDRMYKIFMTAMVVVIAGLLLATGIIAIQKSMKMNLSFEANPNYLFEVYIQKSGDDTKKLVFRNYEKSASEGVVMENGFSTLYGNTLSADDTFLETYGSDFEFIIENHTKNSGMRVSVTANVETEGGHEGILPTITEDKMTATKLKDGSTADYIRFSVTTTEVVFPQTTVLNIVFSEYNEYAVGVSPSSGNFTYTANPVAISGENYTANIKAKTGYSLEITVARDDGTTTPLIEGQGNDYVWDSSTGALTIYASAVTGDITINCLNNNAISYTISYTLNGGDVATANPTAYTVESEITLTNPTKTGYNFAGWTGTGLNGATQSVTISQMTGNRSYTATWTAITYTVAYNANGGSGTMSNSSHTYNSAKNLTANAYTREGYNFTGWNTKSDGSGTSYTNSQSVTNLSSTQDAIVTLYAQWTERIYTITFTSTTNNLQVNSINGTTITKITSLQMKKAETKNVVVTSTTAGQWSRSATYSVTSGSATVSFDSLTGDLTITNPTADTTINVSVSASNTFRPWTYGTYVDSGASTVGTQVSYNTVYYPAFKGYKYIKFQNKSEMTTTNRDGTTQTVPLRWIVIGAGSSVSSATMKNATGLITTAYAGTVNGTAGVNDELTANQVLLLSEKTLLNDSFDDDDKDGSYDSGVDLGDWNASKLKTWLSSTVSTGSPYNGGVGFMTATGLSTYSTYIMNPQYTNSSGTKTNGLITAWYNTSSTRVTTTDTSSKIFLLGSRYGYLSDGLASTNGDTRTYAQWSSQNFVVEDYLGSSTTSWTYADSVRNKSVTETVGDYTWGTTAQKLASFSGSSSSYWWLRSGYKSDNYSAYRVSRYGSVVDINVYNIHGVRPSFILNLG